MSNNKDSHINILTKKPENIFIAICILVVVGFAAFLIFGGKEGVEEAPIKEGQIMIQKGDEIITINQNGLVEYKSKDKVYYETWDTSKISSFFSMVEQKARDSMKNPQDSACVYKIYVFIDGKLVVFCSDDRQIKEVVEELSEKYGGEDLSDFFEDGSDSEEGEDGNSDVSVYFPTATPTIFATTPSPKPTSTQSSQTQTNYPPVEAGCDTWSVDIVGGRAVISNTYCTSEPTPTP